MKSAGADGGRTPNLLRPARSPQRSAVVSYMNELAEIRRLLERSACRRWWEMATVELAGQQTLLVVGAVGISADFKRDRDRDGFAHKLPRSVELALEFSRRQLGALKLQLLPHFSMAPAYESALTELAFQCARILQRLASQRWTVKAQLGAPCLIGSSTAMLALDRHIEESCVDNRPVVLLGSTGNEALQTAVAIHHGCGGTEQAFVKVDCETTMESPWRWVDRARGGTLLVCNPDSGTRADQELLWSQLEQALRQAAQPAADGSWVCRLVVAFKALHSPEAKVRPIPYGAWGQCDWKVITLPQLSQHAEDIPLLARAVLDYHGHNAEHRLTDALQHWCSNYTWPGNASQLEWTVARMAVLTANTPIGASDINLHAPRLLGEAAAGNPQAVPSTAFADDDAVASAPPSSSEYWVHCVLQRDTQAFAPLHAGLARALDYLSLHFHEAVTPEELANRAYVSVSHLRFLFRDSLGLSFKLFLQHVRVEHARRLLLASPQRRITDVALSVGFNDFSHFQKCFRQIVGQTPGKLRRGQALAIV